MKPADTTLRQLELSASKICVRKITPNGLAYRFGVSLAPIRFENGAAPTTNKAVACRAT